MVHYLGQAAVIAILNGQVLRGHVAIVVLIAVVLTGLILALSIILIHHLPVMAVIGPPR